MVAGYFVPWVIAIATLTFAAWGLWGPTPRIAHALVNAVAVLIIACPCALGFVSITVAMGKGATVGVLFKAAQAIEILRDVDTLVVHKTGPLTAGKPSLVSVEPLEEWDERSLLRFAASLERGSEHPLPAAIVAGAGTRGIDLAPVEEFRALPGKGVLGRVQGRPVTLGNLKFMGEMSVDLRSLPERAERMLTLGQTVMFVAVEGKAAGLVGVADPVKETSAEAIRAIHAEGLRLVMLTGDSRMTAESVAKALGIDEVIAEVLPDGKREVVRRLQREGAKCPWRETGSTMPPPWPRPRSGLHGDEECRGNSRQGGICGPSCARGH
jgi:Cu+-exporting ATPase